MTRRQLITTLQAGCCTVLTIALAAPAIGALDDAPQARPRTWLGADGRPLPFRNDEEIKAFLQGADVVGSASIPVGVTNPVRLTLEAHGVRVHAVFRRFEKAYSRARLRDGRLYVDLTDSFRFEPAAYEIARLLGMDNVPPAVVRRIRGRKGTLQIWVYHAHTESERVRRGLVPPNHLRWARQRQQMLLFDALIGNTDRNAGNLLIDGSWNLWLIDHSRAFYARARCEQLDDVLWVDRGLWESLRRLDRETLEVRLDGLLSRARIERLLNRRDRVVDHVSSLIEKRGEEAVLYEAASSPVSHDAVATGRVTR